MLHFWLYKWRFLKTCIGIFYCKIKSAPWSQKKKKNRCIIPLYVLTPLSQDCRISGITCTCLQSLFKTSEKLTVYIQSWPDASQFQNEQFSYINAATVDSLPAIWETWAGCNWMVLIWSSLTMTEHEPKA